MKKILFFLFAAVLAAGGVEAQEAVDSMKIFYRRGYRNVDLSFRDNRAQMERFLNLTEAALKNDRVEKVVIRSYASPDGTAEANERLSVGRAEELKAYLVREGNIPASLIEYHAEGIAWGMLREQVAASDMAGRDEVLDILDHTPLWIYDDDNRIVDGRKKQLMDLQGGKPYNYMLEHFFPELRNSVSTVLYLHIVTQDSETEPEPIAVVPSEEERAPQQEPVRVPADAASMPCETTDLCDGSCKAASLVSGEYDRGTCGILYFVDHFLRLDLIDEAGLRGGCQRSDSVGPAISVLSADGIDLYKQRVRGPWLRR